MRELFGVQVSEGADECSVITSGEFTNEAEQFARSNNITLVTGSDLLVRLAQFNDEQQQPNLHPVPLKCPLCTNGMVLRTARKGANAGSQFWGCPQFPKCRGTREN